MGCVSACTLRVAMGNGSWVRALAGVLAIGCVAVTWMVLSVLLLDLFEPTARTWILRVALAVALIGAGATHLVTLRTNALLRVLAFPVSLTLVLGGMAAVFGTQAWATSRARSAHAARISGEELRGREHRLGFSSSGTVAHPQVTRSTFDEASSEWVAWEGDRVDGEPLPVGSRGVLVLVAEDGSLAVDQAQGLLGSRGARDEAEIAWIAFVSRQWPVSYSYSDGSSTDAERVDVRVVDAAADVLVARVSVGAIPPLRLRHARARYELSDATLVDAIVTAIDADRALVPATLEAWSAATCPVPGPFGPDDDEESLECVDGATPECDHACREGDVAACRAAAFTLEHGSPDRARPYFALACRAGDANACTNFAAGLLRLEREDADVCARAVFERTCEAGEYYGCGMLGGMLARGEGGAEDDARAVTVLEADCAAGHSFACTELGLARHRGEIGDVDDGAALDWLDRACEIDGRGCELARELRLR